MSNILITGGCGFVGSHLARFLIEADYNVILTDLTVNEKLIKDIKGKCTIVKTDVTNVKQLENVLKKYRVDAVAHYAALLSAAIESDPSSRAAR